MKTYPGCVAITGAKARDFRLTVSREVGHLIPLEEMGDLHLHVLVAAAPPDLTRAALEVHHRPCTQVRLSSTALKT